MDSLIFLGKYDQSFLLLEENIINLQEEQDINRIKIKENCPDIVKYQIKGFNFDAWAITGYIKPILQLKGLLSRARIVIFVFNLANSDSLDYLLEGWGPIIEDIDANQSNNQERILIGTRSQPDINRDPVIQKILSLMNKFKCIKYYENGPNSNSSDSEQIGNFPIMTNIIDHIKDELTKPKIRMEILTNDNEINSEPEIIINSDSIFYKLSINKQIAEVLDSTNAKGDITIPESIRYNEKDYPITSICENAFSNSLIKSLSFSNESKVTTIGDFAFKNSKLEMLFLPKSLIKLGKHWIDETHNLSLIHIDKNNTHFLTKNGIFYSIERSEDENNSTFEILFFSKDFSGSCIFPLNIRRAGCFSFYNCQKIEEIVCDKINEAIEIGDNCFKNCTSLKSVSFMNFKSIIIGTKAFDGCRLLNNVKLIGLLDINIDTYCFNEAYNLQSVQLYCTNNLNIGDYCFNKCCSLKSISFQKKLNSSEISTINELTIGKNCFENCISLTLFKCENTNSIKFNEKSFNECHKIENILLTKNKKVDIDNKCLTEMNNLKNLSIQCDFIHLTDKLINNCSLLTSISIENNKELIITSITFNDCHHLTEISLTSNSTLKISKKCFLQMDFLDYIEIKGNEIIIDDDCFNNCANIKDVEFYNKNHSKKIIKIESESFIKIGNNCFNKLNFIESIEIIGQEFITKDRCFNHCNSLSSITISNSSKILIGKFNFVQLSNLSNLSFKNVNFILINSESFDNCNNITKFNITQASNDYTIDYFENFENYSQNNNTQTFIAKTKETQEEFVIIAYSPDYSSNISLFNEMASTSRANNQTILPYSSFGYLTISKKFCPIMIRKSTTYHSLAQIINDSIDLSGTQRYIILLGITFGMKYLHSLKIHFLCLSLENVIFDDKFYPYLCDFGISYKSYNFFNTIYDGHCLWPKRDLCFYSLIAFYLITGIPPKDFQKDVFQNLIHIQDIKIQDLFRRLWLFNQYFAPPFDDIFNEIQNEQYRKLFNADKQEISNYLQFIKSKNLINNYHPFFKIRKEYTTINNKGIIYKLYKNSETAEIENVNQIGDIFIPQYIEFQSTKYEVTKISKSAFAGSSITSLSFSLNSSIEFIDDLSFKNSKIEKLLIPSSLKKVGNYWIYEAQNLINIEVDQTNNNFYKKDDILYYTDCSQIHKIIFIPRDLEGALVVPSNFTGVGVFSFYNCSKIYRVVLNSNSLQIDSFSFYKMKKLKELYIVCSSLKLEKNWINDCKSLESISIFSQKLQITPIFFNGCDSITNIKLVIDSSLEISKDSFLSLKKLKSIEFICDYILCEDDWINKNTNLQLITIQSKQNLIINSNDFKGYNSLQNIKIMSNSELQLKKDSFSMLKSLESINIIGNEIKFDNGWINNCANIKTISIEHIKDAVITQNIFNNCNSITTLIIISKSEITFQNNRFHLPKLTSIEITGNKVIINNNCFSYSEKLENLKISSHDIIIGDNSFDNCNKLTKILIEDNQKILFKPNAFSSCIKLNQVRISSEYVEVMENCFKDSKIQSIVFKCDKLIIGQNCFSKCTDLKSILFEDVKSATIHSYAFNKCSCLSEFNINVSSKLTLCDNCFSGASSLKSVNLKSSELYIGDFIFNDSNCIQSVIINYPRDNATISDNAFANIKSKYKAVLQIQ